MCYDKSNLYFLCVMNCEIKIMRLVYAHVKREVVCVNKYTLELFTKNATRDLCRKFDQHREILVGRGGDATYMRKVVGLGSSTRGVPLLVSVPPHSHVALLLRL